MGIDVRFRCSAATSASELNRVLGLHDRYGWVDANGFKSAATHLRSKGRYHYVESLFRFYDEGYERGYWPEIRALALALREVATDGSLEYGGDEGYFGGHAVDDDLIARLDSLWMSSVRGRSDAAARRELPEGLALRSERVGRSMVYSVGYVYDGHLHGRRYEMTAEEESARATTGVNPDKHLEAVILALRR